MSRDRMPPIPEDRMTPEQRAAMVELTSGPRGKIGGPFVPLVRSPELMSRLQKVGEYLRFHNTVGLRNSEFAVLVVARHWSQPVEWAIHRPIAEREGVLPATFVLLLGAALRRWVSHHPFVYVLGRGFLGSVLCIFAASLLAQWTGHELPNVGTGLSLIGFWLMAWGDAFITGMVCAIFVAFKPQWLATWSDHLYLKS